MEKILPWWGFILWFCLRRMEDDFIEAWKSLWLTEVERLEVRVAPKVSNEIIRWQSLSLLGLVVVEKAINKKVFRYTMKNIWKTKGKMDFKEVGFNMFVIAFHNNLDLHRVHNNFNKQFDCHLICLSKYDVQLAPH